MPRRNTSNIRSILIRLDMSKPDEAVIYEHYLAHASAGHGAQWIRKALHAVLGNALYGSVETLSIFEGLDAFINPKSDSTTTVDVEGAITESQRKLLPPEVIAPFEPPPRTNVFNIHAPRPIPGFIGRKTE